MFQTTNQMMDHGFSSYFPHFAMARTCRDFLPHFQTHPQTWHRSRMCSAKGQFWQPSKSWTPWTCGENESCLACRKNMIFFILSGDSQKRTCGHWLYGLYGLQLNVAHLLAPFRILQHPSASGLSLLPFFLGLCFCFFLSDLSKDQQKKPQPNLCRFCEINPLDYPVSTLVSGEGQGIPL